MSHEWLKAECIFLLIHHVIHHLDVCVFLLGPLPINFGSCVFFNDIRILCYTSLNSVSIPSFSNNATETAETDPNCFFKG